MVRGHQSPHLCAKQLDAGRETLRAQNDGAPEWIYGGIRPGPLDVLIHLPSMLCPPNGPAQVPEVDAFGHPT